MTVLVKCSYTGAGNGRVEVPAPRQHLANRLHAVGHLFHGRAFSHDTNGAFMRDSGSADSENRDDKGR